MRKNNWPKMANELSAILFATSLASGFKLGGLVVVLFGVFAWWGSQKVFHGMQRLELTQRKPKMIWLLPPVYCILYFAVWIISAVF